MISHSKYSLIKNHVYNTLFKDCNHKNVLLERCHSPISYKNLLECQKSYTSEFCHYIRFS